MTNNVIVEIRAGTGGDEAALFVADLMRMYCMYATKHHIKYDVTTATRTGQGGYKEVIIFFKNGYDLFKYESGVHRVQRIHKTEAKGRVHTSAVTVAVMPEVEETEITIKDDDLKIDTFKSSGKGGQHVNKTESAIRITHKPTGIVVECQNERSQTQNREIALRILKAKLLDKQRDEQKTAEMEYRRNQVGSGDRSERIRTYNYPQNRITDHRINKSINRLDYVLDGNLDILLDKFNE